MEASGSTSVAIGFSSEEENRRQSQSSSKTASVSDLTEEDDAQTVSTIDIVTIIGDDESSSRSSGCASRCDAEVGSDWTKCFHNLVDEAPLIEASTSVSKSDHHGFPTQEFSVDGGGEKAQDSESAQTLECHWLDPELLEEGRKFVRRNFFAVLLAHFIGVAFLITVRPIQSLLLRTSALHRKENTMRRYLKMILYLKRFYESPNVISKAATSSSSHSSDDCCQNDILYIQTLQRNAAKNFKVYVPPPWEDLKLTLEEQEIYLAVQEDTKQLNGICTNTKNMPKILFTVNPEVPLSQYDLVIVQHAFFGFIAQFPKVFGIYEKVDRHGTSKGINGFIHMWAVLGHTFGIEDRFNLCIPKNYDPETNYLIFKQVFLFSYKTLNESAMRLWRSMTAGSSRYFFFFRTKAMMLFMCRDVAQIESCKHLSSIMKPMEKFCYYFYKFLIDWLLWIPPFRLAMNCSLRLSVLLCQYCLRRAKKGESSWNAPTPTICVIDPVMLKEIGRASNGVRNA